jgi:hypothetical protein
MPDDEYFTLDVAARPVPPASGSDLAEDAGVEAAHDFAALVFEGKRVAWRRGLRR